MPQKRNPDVLELARGKAQAVRGYLAATEAVTSGLPLGYWRDFQVTKPHLVLAITDTKATLQLLRSAIAEMTVDATAVGVGADDESISATDVAESLVAHGLPFRTAYDIVARAFAVKEIGGNVKEALADAGLSVPALDAAWTALVPKAERRDTLGGPAPVRVADAVTQLRAQHLELTDQLEDAIGELPVLSEATW